MGALWLYAIIVKETDIYDLDLKQKKRLNNVKFVTRLARQRMMNTIIKHGQTACQMKQHHSIMDRHLIQKVLKTTKFIQSTPIVTIRKGIIPF
jgi:hypothetical protein